jgi:hypothetical protein
MPTECHHVWVWEGAEGLPTYVGRGRTGPRGQHPAIVRWEARYDRESELTLWLRTLGAEPRRVANIPHCTMSAACVQAVWSGTRRQYEDLGIRLKSDRPTDRDPKTYNAGKKLPRAVIGPNGDLYPSVRAAARDVGLTPAAITLHCQRRGAWRYLDELETQQ